LVLGNELAGEVILDFADSVCVDSDIVSGVKATTHALMGS
jgi:hypothetical protein